MITLKFPYLPKVKKNNKLLTCLYLKDLQVTNVAQMMKYVSRSVENIVEKGGNALFSMAVFKKENKKFKVHVLLWLWRQL